MHGLGTLINVAAIVVAGLLGAGAGKLLNERLQDGLAKAAGVSRQTISAIEKGDYNPSINLCISICKLLGKTLDELFWPE